MTMDRPAASNRGQFRKGQSGNPAGRPKRRQVTAAASAFEVVLDRTLTLTRDGAPDEISLEEALQHKTYQDALAGKRLAIRQVLRWIEKRELWLAERNPKPKSGVRILGYSRQPGNANAALKLLGIAAPHTGDVRKYQHDALMLEPWAVAAALRRPGGKKFTKEDIEEIRRCTRDPDSIRLPEPVDP